MALWIASVFGFRAKEVVDHPIVPERADLGFWQYLQNICDRIPEVIAACDGILMK